MDYETKVSVMKDRLKNGEAIYYHVNEKSEYKVYPKTFPGAILSYNRFMKYDRLSRLVWEYSMKEDLTLEATMLSKEAVEDIIDNYVLEMDGYDKATGAMKEYLEID